ncbi:MAG: oligopeptide transporter, OPT family [Tenuifilaceae bacterium]|jgi:putative OPT family oligopeptide transporter|nr:oligopeptide transporter, OPT family [Bacteroidales bacterium]MDI9515815.1 oligopeptide transporter, OPT family [Bacteroidota bacterium]OQC62217.1 MAG: OPT oligopeptide transporter protein [Bacteroidetes bacterium ADurb.Bin008]HNV81095.1 oligopeptide transporter, OPT family [Tenuifilaceae bacterium]MZP83180.1 oligopeptide transporter, OPT family [Bacteroidales bacterium]
MSEHNDNERVIGLPENAYRELKPGEEYNPVMSPLKIVPEVTLYSVLWGLLMAIIFSAAAAYLGLKIGQVFEAAIPIAIIAIGISALTKRKNALGENIIIQSIGSSSGVIVAGAIFTLPALYILNLEAHFYQVFFSSLLGGVLGILFLIPFRKYFVQDMHGQYPFPEATATTEVLISGEKGGKQAKLLLISGLVGGIYDFIIATFGWWSEVFTTRVIPFGATLANKAKMVFQINVGAAIVGLGYIIGLKYAAIICAGSFVGWFVFIPFLNYFAEGMASPVGTNALLLIGDMSAEEIFSHYIRPIGIGGIAMAGIIGIIRSWNIIKQAVGLAVSETVGRKGGATKEELRTRRDLPMKIIGFGLIAAALLIFIFFQFGVVHNLTHALVGLGIVMIIAFLFTTVAANAIAIVGTNPVSGMTLMTLIIASIILASVGLSGESGMVAALIIGGVVCTALSMAGGFITDLKIGYWLGSSPYKQQSWKFLGTLVAAATVGGVIILLNKTYGFTGEGALVAPQANAMAAVIEPMMSGKPAPWLLYTAGAMLSLILTMINVPALAFSLGMFIPLHLNTPLLVGGIIAHIVATRSKDAKVNQARRERGTLIASGFIAGGALMGVVSAILKFGGINFVNPEWFASNAAQILGLGMFLVICAYLALESLRGKPDAE